MQDDERHVPVVIRKQAAPKGALAKAATSVAKAGRFGDDMVIHINRSEFDTLRKEWGEPTVNPDTGMPEFAFGGLPKWLQYVLPVGGALLGGDFLGSGISDLTGGAISGTTANALGSAALGGGLGALTGGGRGALTGALLGGATPIIGGALGLTGSGGMLSGLLGGAGGAAGAFNGGAGSLTQGLADRGAATAFSSPSFADSAGSGSGMLGGLFQSKNILPLAITAAALGQAVASKSPSAAQKQAQAQNQQAQGNFNQHLASTVPFVREQVPMTAQDYYRYGMQGGRQQFANNQLPGLQQYARGGQTHAGSVAVPATPVPQHPGTPTGSYVQGPGGGRDDTIPAKLSNNEYVIDAETTSMLGNGSPDEGAKRLDEMRAHIRKHKGGALSRGKISPDAKHPLQYLKGGAK